MANKRFKDWIETLTAAGLDRIPIWKQGIDKERYIEIVNLMLAASGSLEPNPQIPAGSFDFPPSDPAPLDTDSGSNGTIKRHLFNDTVNESVIRQGKVPSDIDPAGTVTFILYGYPVTAAADDLIFRLSHAAVANNESWDAAFSDEDSTALTCINTQDFISRFTWTETVANLDWTANDFLRYILTRVATSGSDTLSGDFAPIFFEIDIPRA